MMKCGDRRVRLSIDTQTLRASRSALFADWNVLNYIVSGDQIEAVAELMEHLGLNARDLDDLVVMEKREEASDLNAEGMESQINYLIGRLSEEELETVLRNSIPGATAMEIDGSPTT
jgi:hypothetical protein